jgi:hypothetical protein
MAGYRVVYRFPVIEVLPFGRDEMVAEQNHI